MDIASNDATLLNFYSKDLKSGWDLISCKYKKFIIKDYKISDFFLTKF